MTKLLLSVALLAPATLVLAQTSAPALAPLPPAPAPAPTTKVAEDPNKVIIEAGDQKVTIQDFNNLIDSLPPQVQAMAKGPGKRMLADKLVEVKLLSSEAHKLGLDKEPKVQTQLELSREQVLAQAMAEKAQKSGGDEAALKQQYEAKKAELEQVKARHILIRAKGSPAPATPGKAELTDEQAKAKAADLRDQIVNKKGDFAALAKAESDDRGSAAQGGDLGFFGKGQMVGDFEKSAFSMKPGEVSEPIKTPFGYHIIQVEEHKTPAFDEVKDELASQQGPQKVEAFVKKLKEQGNVKIDESFFGPAMTRPAMPPQPQ